MKLEMEGNQVRLACEMRWVHSRFVRRCCHRLGKEKQRNVQLGRAILRACTLLLSRKEQSKLLLQERHFDRGNNDSRSQQYRGPLVGVILCCYTHSLRCSSLNCVGASRMRTFFLLTNKLSIVRLSVFQRKTLSCNTMTEHLFC